MQPVKIFSLFLLAVAAVEAGPGPSDPPEGDIDPTTTVGPGIKRWISEFILKREEVPQPT
jgi:hypothetical protein